MTALRCESPHCATPFAAVSAGYLVLRGRHHGEHHELALPLAQLLEATVDAAALPVVAAALLSRLAQPPGVVLESAQTI